MMRCLVLSDFNVANFAGLMGNDEESPPLAPTLAPFGGVVPVLADGNHEGWRERPDLAFVWTLPEGVIGSYGKLVDEMQVDADRVLSEVDDFAALIGQAASRVRWLFVASWVHDSGLRGAGMNDWHATSGRAQMLARMNLRLAERLAPSTNVVVLDAESWMRNAGAGAFDDKLWYQGKIPFSHAVFREAVLDLKAAVRGLSGRARKLVVLDLDETMWVGIVGEVGWQGVRLGGHDAIGEAYADFQRALKRLTRRGIVLGVVSRNDEETALAVFRHHPEMQLRLEDLAGWRIGWGDKAQALADLVSELNLGLESVVFIDDHPVERDRIRAALPEVLVPEWPRNPMAFRRALLSLRCFDQPTTSAEDRQRTGSYVSERERTELRRRVSSIDDWLRSLEMVVTTERLSASNLARAAQLLNKTNQMNLTTRRMGEQELAAWANQEGHEVWLFRVADRFGDSGITGLGSLDIRNGQAQVVDFVLSCRVMGRKVEETMLHWLVSQGSAGSARLTWAEYLPTPKNPPCLEFWKRSGFESENGSRFVWAGGRAYPLPSTVSLDGASVG